MKKTNLMFYATITLLAFYFLVGSLLIYAINKRKGESKQRWTKFATYFVIVYTIILAANFSSAWFVLLSAAIVIIGHLEIVSLHLKSVRQNSLLLLILFFYSIVSILFLLFAGSRPGNELIWLYMLVLTFDGFSQLSGQLFGKIKIAPSVSPGKTLEGVLGGFTLVIITAFVLKEKFLWTVPALTYWIMVLVIAGGALIGDLLAFACKRKYGVKDYSTLIPGHGGILDRFDSFMGAASGYMLFLYV
jgi:phosphatidate cytidylyltransferase